MLIIRITFFSYLKYIFTQKISAQKISHYFLQLFLYHYAFKKYFFMKKTTTYLILFAAGFLLLFLYTNTANAQKADDIIGQYYTPKKDGKIQIFKVGNHYEGKLIWGKSNRKDHKNPNAALRSRNLVGMVFLTNFVYDDGEYKDGKIYDPQSGKTYSSKMWLSRGDLKVRGFVGVSLLGRTEVFTRVR